MKLIVMFIIYDFSAVFESSTLNVKSCCFINNIFGHVEQNTKGIMDMQKTEDMGTEGMLGQLNLNNIKLRSDV